MNILTEYKAEQFLEKEGFPVAERTLCTTEKEALSIAKKHQFQGVLKVASGELLHKTEAHAVKLTTTEDTFHKHYQELNKLNFKKEGILVQNYVQGICLLAGLKKDPVFGHVLAVGLGGIYTEILKDISFRVLPLEKKDVKEMLQELKGDKLLTGYRGEKKVNLKKV